MMTSLSLAKQNLRPNRLHLQLMLMPHLSWGIIFIYAPLGWKDGWPDNYGCVADLVSHSTPLAASLPAILTSKPIIRNCWSNAASSILTARWTTQDSISSPYATAC